MFQCNVQDVAKYFVRLFCCSQAFKNGAVGCINIEYIHVPKNYFPEKCFQLFYTKAPELPETIPIPLVSLVPAESKWT